MKGTEQQLLEQRKHTKTIIAEFLKELEDSMLLQGPRRKMALEEFKCAIHLLSQKKNHSETGV